MLTTVRPSSLKTCHGFGSLWHNYHIPSKFQCALVGDTCPLDKSSKRAHGQARAFTRPSASPRGYMGWPCVPVQDIGCTIHLHILRPEGCALHLTAHYILYQEAVRVVPWQEHILDHCIHARLPAGSDEDTKGQGRSSKDQQAIQSIRLRWSHRTAAICLLYHPHR